MNIQGTKVVIFFLLVIIVLQKICDAMSPKRDKTYKLSTIQRNIHLQESNSFLNELRYIGAAFSDSNLLIKSLQKFLTAVKALYFSISTPPKEVVKTKIEDVSAPKLLKPMPENHSYSSDAEDEEDEGEEEEHEEQDSLKAHKKKEEVLEKPKPVLRLKLFKDLVKFGELYLAPFLAKLETVANGEVHHQSQAHLNTPIQHYDPQYMPPLAHPDHLPHLQPTQHIEGNRRRKREAKKSEDLSLQMVSKSPKNSKSANQKEALSALVSVAEMATKILQMLAKYKEGFSKYYSHCNEDHWCIQVISGHLKDFSRWSGIMNKQLKTKFLGEPEFDVKTAEEINEEMNRVITRVEAFLEGVSIKEDKKLNISQEALREVFELDLQRMDIPKGEQITIKILRKLEVVLGEELKQARRFELKFPEYVEQDHEWLGILLHSMFQVKRIEEIYKARWHEIKAFMLEKDHTNHSFHNCMYYQGPPPANLKVDDSGAAVFMIIENARQYMDVLNECISIDAKTKTLHLDWNKMARMGPFGHFTAAKLVENYDSPRPNTIIYLAPLNKRLRGMEKLLSAAKEVLFQLHAKQIHSSYWTGVIAGAYKQLHSSAYSMEQKMEQLLGIHQQQEELRKAQGEMDVDQTAVYKIIKNSKGQTRALLNSLLHLRDILSTPILDIHV